MTFQEYKQNQKPLGKIKRYWRGWCRYMNECPAGAGLLLFALIILLAFLIISLTS